MALLAQGATIKTQNTMKCKVHMMVFTNMIKEPSLMHYDDTVFFCFFLQQGLPLKSIQSFILEHGVVLVRNFPPRRLAEYFFVFTESSC